MLIIDTNEGKHFPFPTLFFVVDFDLYRRLHILNSSRTNFRFHSASFALRFLQLWHEIWSSNSREGGPYVT